MNEFHSPNASLAYPRFISYSAPYGAHPGDSSLQAILAANDGHGRSLLAASETGSVYGYPKLRIAVKVYTPPATGERAWKMMHLAAESDSSVAILGRVFRAANTTEILGYAMPMETPLDSSTIPAEQESRIRIIHQIRDLVAGMHAQNIVHGDLKPRNLLICSDGRLRFCDFDDVSVEGDGLGSTAQSAPYCSPSRMRDRTQPVTRAEDLYAMGLTMWEVYTGRTPLTYGDENLDPDDSLLECRCRVGFLPEMKLIDDPVGR